MKYKKLTSIEPKKAFSERQSLLVGEIENKKGQRLTAIKRRLALFNRGKIRSAGQPNHLSKFPDPFFCLSKNEVSAQPLLSVTMDAQFPCQKGFFKSSHHVKEGLGSARRQYSFYETSFSMLFTIYFGATVTLIDSYQELAVETQAGPGCGKFW